MVLGSHSLLSTARRAPKPLCLYQVVSAGFQSRFGDPAAFRYPFDCPIRLGSLSVINNERQRINESGITTIFEVSKNVQLVLGCRSERQQQYKRPT